MVLQSPDKSPLTPYCTRQTPGAKSRKVLHKTTPQHDMKTYEPLTTLKGSNPPYAFTHLHLQSETINPPVTPNNLPSSGLIWVVVKIMVPF